MRGVSVEAGCEGVGGLKLLAWQKLDPGQVAGGTNCIRLIWNGGCRIRQWNTQWVDRSQN